MCNFKTANVQKIIVRKEGFNYFFKKLVVSLLQIEANH
ncbi:hypothetical protein CAPGI0001_0834 [Capnocytophaga gingivalis ATCC 33624]|nr:hypothetical protein CAPGI0001_0834 [Capnocytophaga gingivalis ATCC 33624]